jgi:hypothetical protein
MSLRATAHRPLHAGGVERHHSTGLCSRQLPRPQRHSWKQWGLLGPLLPGVQVSNRQDSRTAGQQAGTQYSRCGGGHRQYSRCGGGTGSTTAVMGATGMDTATTAAHITMKRQGKARHSRAQQGTAGQALWATLMLMPVHVLQVLTVSCQDVTGAAAAALCATGINHMATWSPSLLTM